MRQADASGGCGGRGRRSPRGSEPAAGPGRVLEIPERAVVVAGARPLADEWARGQGLAAAAAIIIKDRDASTDARAVLEEGLRR